MRRELSSEAACEIERLLSLTMSERQNEGVYTGEAQLRLLLKRVKSGGSLAGATKFVADFAGMDSKLLYLVDRLESESGG